MQLCNYFNAHYVKVCQDELKRYQDERATSARTGDSQLKNMTNNNETRSDIRSPTKRDETKCTKCRFYVKFICAHLFSHIGLCGLVVGYTIMGAFAFEAIENSAWSKSYPMHEAHEFKTTHEFKTAVSCDEVAKMARSKSTEQLKILRRKYADDLWNLTYHMNVLFGEQWIDLALERIERFENEAFDVLFDVEFEQETTIKANLSEIAESEKLVQDLVTPKAHVQWTFPAALLYCVTVITTIGYGNIAPRTSIGKIVTIFYALIGIPLMLLCLSNIGDLLANAFKFTYNKICCALCRKPPPTVHCEEMLLSNNLPITNQLMSPVLSTSSTGSVPPVSNQQQNSEDHTMPDVQRCTPEEPLPDGDTSLDNNSLDVEQDQKYPEIIMMPEILTNNEKNSVIDKSLAKAIQRREEYYENQDRVPVFIVLLFVAFYVCLGAAIFSIWEKWSFLDGAYFCFITLSTIGFGDLVPGTSFDIQQEQGQAKLIICCFYLIVGLSIIAMSFNLVQEEVLVKCRRVGQNLGIYKNH